VTDPEALSVQERATEPETGIGTETETWLRHRFGTPRRVSVVLPVRNGADVIARQLDALAGQTYAGEWEVVVADNGSTDGTADVVAKWADRLPDLRVVDASARPGVGPARNVGTRAATGDAVLYCDADDRCAPDWVSCMVAALADHPIVGGPCSVEAPDGTVYAAPVKLHLTLRAVPFAIGGNFGVWIDVFERVGGFEAEHPEAKAEDAEFCIRAWEHGYEAGFAPGALMVKARRGDLTSTYHQWHGYGMGTMFNVCRYRDRGLPRLLLEQEVRHVGWMILHLSRIRTHDGRHRWVRWASGRIGWIEGYLRFRRLPVAPRPAGARPLRPAPGTAPF
jgi:glycosyltransferase involved in cell wall biosynthesis